MMRKVDDVSGTRVTPFTVATAASLFESEHGLLGYWRPGHYRHQLGEEKDIGEVAELRSSADESAHRRTSGASERGHEAVCLSRARQRRPRGAEALPHGPRPELLRYRPWTPSISVVSMALMLLACVLLQPVTAVKVPFQNCLPDSYRYNQPTLLQWLPYQVDAWFDAENPKHTLTMTMWGNVTGSLYNVTLPPANSTAWTDPSKLDGKILGEPEPDSDAPKLTTLHSKINFLTYEPWSDNTNFCNTSLTNAKCPLAPIFNTTDL